MSCTNNRLEFCSNEFNTLCKKERIVRHHTIRHTPKQNGVVEGMNMTLKKMSDACFLMLSFQSLFGQKSCPLHVI